MPVQRRSTGSRRDKATPQPSRQSSRVLSQVISVRLRPLRRSSRVSTSTQRLVTVPPPPTHPLPETSSATVPALMNVGCRKDVILYQKGMKLGLEAMAMLKETASRGVEALQAYLWTSEKGGYTKIYKATGLCLIVYIPDTSSVRGNIPPFLPAF